MAFDQVLQNNSNFSWIAASTILSVARTVLYVVTMTMFEKGSGVTPILSRDDNNNLQYESVQALKKSKNRTENKLECTLCDMSAERARLPGCCRRKLAFGVQCILCNPSYFSSNPLTQRESRNLRPYCAFC